jgi:MoaA/NifB/PqqE/SkfB family radical SAM enzyme
MELQVSLDGAIPNETTVKVLKPLQPKLEALRKAARFKVVLSAVLGAAPSGEVLEVIDYARTSGFRPRVLLLHDGGGKLKLTSEQIAEFHTVKAALARHRFREARDYRTRLFDEGSAPFKCRAGSRYLYIDEFGDVHWCSQTRSAFSLPLEQYGLDELKQQFDTVKTCAPHCTVGCVRTQSAYDEWRAQSREHPEPAKTRLPVVG